MKRKNNFFLIGMTSVLLAFAMIGCDNGTSNGGSNVTPPIYTPPTNNPPPEDVDTEAKLYLALGNGKAVTVNIINDVDLTTELTLTTGQHIVVGGSVPGGIDVSAGRVGDGPLFAASGVTNGALNLKAKLTLAEGSSLTVAGGAAVNVITPADARVEAQRETRLVVESGAAVVLTGTGTTAGKVNIEPLAEAHFATGAILAVTTDSKVTLEGSGTGVANYGAITIEKGAAVAIVGANATDKVDLLPSTGGGTPIIVIPEGAPADIGIDTVYTNYDETTGKATGEAGADSTLKTAVVEQVEKVADASPYKTTDKATTEGENKGVQALLGEDGVTRVTYTGNTALTGITVGNGQTLVITGEVTGQTAAIGGTGTLEITGSVTTATENITQAILASLVKATGTGTVVLNSNVEVSSPLEVNLTLEIGESVTFTLSNNGTVTGTGTIVNNGTIKSTQDMTINGAELGESLLLSGGTFEVTAAVISVAAGSTLTIPADTELKLSGNATLTVAANATLTNEATIAFDAGSTLTVDGSGTIDNSEDGATIETKSGTVLAVLLDNVDDGTIEVTANTALAASAEVAVGEEVTLEIANGVTLTVNGTLTVDGTIEGDGSITTAGSGKVEVAETGSFTLSSGTVTGNVTQDMSGIALSTATDDNPTGLNIDSVKKDLTTGDSNGFITITLKGGPVGPSIPAGDVYNLMFGSPNGADTALIAEPGAYSWAALTGLYTSAGGKITQYNQAFNMWIEEASGHSDFITGWDTDDVYKERTYDALGEDPFYIVLWDGWNENGGDTPRIITLEITQPADGNDTKTFLIDYTTVAFDDGE